MLEKYVISAKKENSGRCIANIWEFAAELEDLEKFVVVLAKLIAEDIWEDAGSLY